MESVLIVTGLILGFAIALAMAFGALDLLFAAISPAPYRSKAKPMTPAMEMAEK